MLVLTFASYSRRLIKPVVHRTFTVRREPTVQWSQTYKENTDFFGVRYLLNGQIQMSWLQKMCFNMIREQHFLKIIREFLSEEYHYSSCLRRHCRNTTKLFFVSGLRTRRHTWRHFKKRPRDSKLFDRHHRQMHGNKTKNSNFQMAH